LVRRVIELERKGGGRKEERERKGVGDRERFVCFGFEC
jgi:hypothetical protein